MQPTHLPNVPPGELPEPYTNYVSSQEGVPALEIEQAQAIERGAAPTMTQPPVIADPVPLPLPTIPAPATDAALAMPVSAGYPPQSSSMPAIADDSDLIEKEWVMKAKHIVEQTKTDPYLQTKEINRMKADYLKKRYAKDLRLTED